MTPAVQEDLQITTAGGSSIRLGVGFKMLDSEAHKQQAAPKQSSSRQEAAEEAKSYLVDNGVQLFLQEMVQALLKHRPTEPLDYMSDFIAERKKTGPPLKEKKSTPAAQSSPVKPQKSPSSTGGKSSEGEYPRGFPIDVAPEVMPDLSAHCSLMADVLQKDPSVYQKLRCLKTSLGVTFAQLIKPGVDVKGHKMIKTAGLAVGDSESYEVFEPLLKASLGLRFGDQLVEEPQQLHMDASKVCSDALDPTGENVVSVRVQVSRNLSSFRFPTACSEDERREVERVLVKAFQLLSEDLGGDYYPLAESHSCAALGMPKGMSEESEEKLRRKGFLFEEPDSAVSLSSGLARQWPDARGVFCNQSENIWAWVNEEDHLKLFSGQPDSNLHAAFSRLAAAEKSLQIILQQEGLNFACSEKLGYLSSSPHNVGTSLCATVVMRLPFLSATPNFRSMCAKLKLQVKAVDGKSWAVSNTERLGTSEAEQISRVASSCKELLAAEKQLASSRQTTTSVSKPLDSPAVAARNVVPPKPAASKALPDAMPALDFSSMPGLGSKEFPGFPTDICPEEMPDLTMHNSLTAQVLKSNPCLYHQLNATKTRSGVSLAKVIKPCMDNKGHPMIKTFGAYAGDEESYTVFGKLFTPALELYHGFSSQLQHRTDLDPMHTDAAPIDPSGKYFQSVQISTARNLRGFRLPPAASRDELRAVEQVLACTMCDLDGVLAGNYLPLAGSCTYTQIPGGMSSEQEGQLRDAGALFQEPDSTLDLSAGWGRHWPAARGVFAGDDLKTWAWINEEDHLRLFVEDSSSNLRSAFERLSSLESVLAQSLAQQGHGFMHSDSLGYLTSCPSNVGPALLVRLTVRLPLLTARSDFKEICRVLGLANARVSPDDKAVQHVSNVLGLGVSEADLVNSTAKACSCLISLEQALERGETIQRPGLGPDALPIFKQVPTGGLQYLRSHSGAAAAVLRAHPEIYDQLRDKSTARVPFSGVAGVTLGMQAGVRSGLLGVADGSNSARQRPGWIGLCAGDEECYDVFQALFAPALELYLGESLPTPYPAVALTPDAVSGKTQGVIADPQGKLSVRSVRVQLSRNLKGLPFIPACSFAERREVERILTKALTRQTGTYFPSKGSTSCAFRPAMTDSEEQQLRSQGLLFQEPKAPGLLACGAGRHWPDARGVFLMSSEGTGTNIAAWINEEEHISFVACRNDGDLKAAFAAVCEAEALLKAELEKDGLAFSYSERLGFLTAMPGKLGGGLLVRVLMDVPQMSACRGISDLSEKAGLEVALRHSRPGGATVEVANRSSFGISEAGLVSSIADACVDMMRGEE
eukprot:TRINITY_DN23022_c0_g1_i1.p1 TRINITY_DN23022_c0_g1~~TRINITY_DN23022_c0_g1_i1.p1  ORF type:complete len:1401 (-),score=279.85 TRINITY_DN23022_c0_g1_i1:237-4202(-)